MIINFSDTMCLDKDVLIVGVPNDDDLPDHIKALDEETGGAIIKALAANDITKFGKVIELVVPSGLSCNRLLLIGIGEEAKINCSKLQSLGGIICSTLFDRNDRSAFLHFGSLNLGSVDNSKIGPYIANGILNKKWQFDKYLTNRPQKDVLHLTELTVFTLNISESEVCMEELDNVTKGVITCKYLATEPPNVIYPESYATYIDDKLSALDIEIDILDDKSMKKLGMNCLLAVGEGSDKESRLVVMKWNGAGKEEPYYGFVGKGVCFDTGGISIKPSLNMDEMKYDMCGSAAVVGLLEAVARNKLAKNVVGVVGLVENMPSGKAARPSDIVTSMSGQTVEILNTDAEGRLVLADALWYIQEKYNPQFIVDLATLTGAIVVSLAGEFAGLFSNDDDLALNLFKSGMRTSEKLWRMPLCEAFDRDMDSDVADMRNIGPPREAGSSTAGQFLQRFVKCPWAHLDIAGTAWDANKGSHINRKGATGFGVRLLYDLLKSTNDRQAS